MTQDLHVDSADNIERFVGSQCRFLPQKDSDLLFLSFGLACFIPPPCPSTTAKMRANALSLLALAGISYAQFPPTPEGVTEIESKFGDGVRLSWKEVGLMLCSGSWEQLLTATERHL
jgi:hypothetical protein